MRHFWFDTKTHEMDHGDFLVYNLSTHGYDMMSTKG